MKSHGRSLIHAIKDEDTGMFIFTGMASFLTTSHIDEFWVFKVSSRGQIKFDPASGAQSNAVVPFTITNTLFIEQLTNVNSTSTAATIRSSDLLQITTNAKIGTQSK
ncbi:MAG: hypothetical protein HY606_07120 [Planctomycetes bacterium]|nr:hypothetical protein [Planctomycetota bacterium]